MISKQRATSVGFDDLVDAFRFECRVQELNGCRKIYPKDPKIYLFIFTLLCSEIFHSLFVSTSSNQTFTLSKFFAVLSLLPPLFHAQKSPLLNVSPFIFCVLCHFYRSTLCVCVLKYILNLRYAQFHHLPTQDF